MNPTFLSKYTLINKIGEGSFSDVLKCQDKLTGINYAAKRLKKVFKSTYDVANCAEIIAMSKLTRHPNVVYMMEFHYDPANGKLIFIFELMDMSIYDLMKLKKRQDERIPELKVRSYLYQILKGLDHLHSQGLFHRDIKPENILIKLPNSTISRPPNQFQGEVVKLADLGSIRGIYSKQPYTEYISTRWYRSPECLLTIGYYGPKMDIWATGCVFYEMLTLKPLFPGQNEVDQLGRIHEVLGTPSERIMRKLKKKSRNFSNFPKQTGIGLKSITEKISDDAITILKLMIQYDPDLRINVRRLLEHTFFRTLREDELIQKFKFRTKHNTNNGDSPRVSIPADTGRNIKYKCELSRSSEPIKNKSGYSLMSKTNVDVLGCNKPQICNHNLPYHQSALTKQSSVKPVGVNPDILKPKEDDFNIRHEQDYKNKQQKVKYFSQHRSKAMVDAQQGFSKTTSNLPQYSNYKYEKTNIQFQSKSFILPSRNIQRKEKVIDLLTKKANQQSTKYRSIIKNS